MAIVRSDDRAAAKPEHGQTVSESPRYPADRLIDFASSLLQCAGMDADKSKDVAEILGPSGTFLHVHTIAWERDAL